MTDSVSERVLVVDDSPDSLSLISDALEQANISTFVALEGRQALSIAEQMLPDIILLDANMPRMDGFETCQKLKEHPLLRSTPVIFMTGLSDTGHILKGLEAGAVDYLIKPVNPEELIARMKVHLANARASLNAQYVLDSAGQHILAVDRGGAVLWNTPDTHPFLASISETVAENFVVLNAQIMQWLSEQPDTGDSLSVSNKQSPTSKLTLILVEHRPGQEVLLRLLDPRSESGAVTLQKELNLTVRQSEVLHWLAEGKSNKEIARILDMGVRTVNKHLEQIFPKLGVENRTAAAAVALRALHGSHAH